MLRIYYSPSTRHMPFAPCWVQNRRSFGSGFRVDYILITTLIPAFADMRFVTKMTSPTSTPAFPVAITHVGLLSYVVTPQGRKMEPSKLDLLQGTLDLMVLQTLAAMGTMHGYGIARRIEQVSGNEVLLNQGTIYASLVRTEQHGWIASNWGTSDNNRKAKFYSITAAGRRQLAKDARYWQRLTTVMDRVLAMDEETGEEPA
jgi:transcriptional regulator